MIKGLVKKGRLALNRLRVPMKISTPPLARIILIACFSLPGITRLLSDEITSQYDSNILPLIKEFCVECHSTRKAKGELDLERFFSFEAALQEPAVWEKVAEQLSLGAMPPEEDPQPSKEAKQQLSNWVENTLEIIAQRMAGDPGPVVLRRLNNAEMNYTIQDLTGIGTLNPAQMFPPDSAAGEGFMNTGQSLVMSPALLSKYLDSAKNVAAHAVLLPDGMRFSKSTSRRDWTEEILTDIRSLYTRHTDTRGAAKVNLQGIVFDTNQGGRLPVSDYWKALLEIRDSLSPLPSSDQIQQAIAKYATQAGLSPKYLNKLWTMLHHHDTSPLFELLRKAFQKAENSQVDIDELTLLAFRWQESLWQFHSVGHVGKANGPKMWMEAVDPIQFQKDFRISVELDNDGRPLPFYLSATSVLKDKSASRVMWENPRLSMPGLPEIPINRLDDFVKKRTKRLEAILQASENSLNTIVALEKESPDIHLQSLSLEQHVQPDALHAWLNFLGYSSESHVMTHLLDETTSSTSGYDFIQGWGSANTPSIVANASDTLVRIPGNMRGHGIAVHPSPTLEVAIGWKSPVTGQLKVSGQVFDAHPECGNGISWALEWRRGAHRRVLSQGNSRGSEPVMIDPESTVSIRRNDFLILRVGPRDGNHSCDLTDVSWIITDASNENRVWNLNNDLSDDILAGNPHPDSLGNQSIWHFFTIPTTDEKIRTHIPEDSLLAKWMQSQDIAERKVMAHSIQQLLTEDGPSSNPANEKLRTTLKAFTSPLLSTQPDEVNNLVPFSLNAGSESVQLSAIDQQGKEIEFEEIHFDSNPTNGTTFCLQTTAPSIIKVNFNLDWMKEVSLMVTGRLSNTGDDAGSVQLDISNQPSGDLETIRSGPFSKERKQDSWTTATEQVLHQAPVIVLPESPAHREMERHFSAFRNLFPAALCYTKIIPVDEVVTLTLYYREDHHLKNLMLDDHDSQRLDQLWNQLHYVSRDALRQVDAYEQLWQYATQDADPSVFEPLREPIMQKADQFKSTLIATEPNHVNALVDFARRAFRRSLQNDEVASIHKLYEALRDQELPHEDAIRLVLSKILISPSFLYRLEQAPPDKGSRPVSEWELASRLSYFLWSSQPDTNLLEAAEQGKLSDPDNLSNQTRRMLQNPKVRRLAREFATAWLHLYDFDTMDEKSPVHFPEFELLREDMLEEVTLFFTDLFQTNGSLLAIWKADYTFLNENLSKHYGIPWNQKNGWHKTSGVREYGRGGILGFAATLSKQSGASRTSPILRGNWISESILGDALPKPPPNVPQLPEEENTESLSIRELTEKHSNDPKCAGCHRRIDPFGYALESYDAIGRLRTHDLANRPIDTATILWEGKAIQDAAGLRDFLVLEKRNRIVRQFCKKLLGYALGRSVILSDRPLLDAMQKRLEEEDYRIHSAVDAIVQSKQFRFIRGKHQTDIDSSANQVQDPIRSKD